MATGIRIINDSGTTQIENPKTWSAESFMALCQQCHNGTSSVEGANVSSA